MTDVLSRPASLRFARRIRRRYQVPSEPHQGELSLPLYGPMGLLRRPVLEMGAPLTTTVDLPVTERAVAPALRAREEPIPGDQPMERAAESAPLGWPESEAARQSTPARTEEPVAFASAAQPPASQAPQSAPGPASRPFTLADVRQALQRPPAAEGQQRPPEIRAPLRPSREAPSGGTGAGSAPTPLPVRPVSRLVEQPEKRTASLAMERRERGFEADSPAPELGGSVRPAPQVSRTPETQPGGLIVHPPVPVEPEPAANRAAVPAQQPGPLRDAQQPSGMGEREEAGATAPPNSTIQRGVTPAPAPPVPPEPEGRAEPVDQSVAPVPQITAPVQRSLAQPQGRQPGVESPAVSRTDTTLPSTGVGDRGPVLQPPDATDQSEDTGPLVDTSPRAQPAAATATGPSMDRGDLARPERRTGTLRRTPSSAPHPPDLAEAYRQQLERFSFQSESPDGPPPLAGPQAGTEQPSHPGQAGSGAPSLVADAERRSRGGESLGASITPSATLSGRVERAGEVGEHSPAAQRWPEAAPLTPTPAAEPSRESVRRQAVPLERALFGEPSLSRQADERRAPEGPGRERESAGPQARPVEVRRAVEQEAPPSAPQAAARGEAQPEANEPDMDELADRVFRKLREHLRVERERLGGTRLR